MVTIECDSPTELSFAIIRGCIFRGAKREVHLNCMTSVRRPAGWLADRGQWGREEQQQLLTICKRKFNIRPPDKYILIYCCSTGTRIFRPSSLWMGRRYDIVFNENASIFTAQEWLLMSCYLRISFHYWDGIKLNQHTSSPPPPSAEKWNHLLPTIFIVIRCFLKRVFAKNNCNSSLFDFIVTTHALYFVWRDN